MNELSQVANDFIHNIALKKGIDVNDQAAYENFSKELMERVNLAVIDQIPGDKLEEFEQLILGDDENKIAEFIKNNVSDLKNILINTISTF